MNKHNRRKQQRLGEQEFRNRHKYATRIYWSGEELIAEYDRPGPCKKVFRTDDKKCDGAK